MAKMIEVTCTRCNGSGKFSFNLRRGTVCFGCEGAGKIAVDAAKHEKANAAKAKRVAQQRADMSRRVEMAGHVHAELDAEFGPFSDDARGAYDAMAACQRAYGMSPGEIVTARLRDAA